MLKLRTAYHGSHDGRFAGQNGMELREKKNLSVTRKPKNVDNNVDKRVTELKELDKENT